MTGIIQNEPMDRDEQAALWCMELAEGELSPERRQALERWTSDPENNEAFQLAATAWEMTEAASTLPELVRMRTDALDAYSRGQMRRWKKPKVARRGLAAIGMAVAAALLAVIGWSWLPDRQSYITPVGERRVAMLEDGSRLSLDADSVVQTSFDTRRRSMTLEKGRARFDVAHNPLRPFTVLAGDKMVVATGTSFTVERLGNEVRVVLINGHVAVVERSDDAGPSAAAARSDIVLSPGRELVMPATGKGPVTVRPVELQRVESWQQGQVSFEDTPLPVAVERMNRYLREPLVVGNQAAGQVRVTGVFDSTDATGFLEALQALSKVRSERRDGKVVLTGK